MGECWKSARARPRFIWKKTSKSSDHYFDALRAAGGNVQWYQPIRWHTLKRFNNRTHRELIIVDGEVGFIGGAGIGAWWTKGTTNGPAWRDTMVRVSGLVTTHYMSEAEHCDHLALMYAGRIVADASPSQMKRDVESEAGHLLELTTTVPHRAVAVLRLAGYAEAALFGTRIHLLSKNTDADIRRLPALLLAENIETTMVAPRPLSMEDVFVYRVSSLEDRDRKATGTAT